MSNSSGGASRGSQHGLLAATAARRSLPLADVEAQWLPGCFGPGMMLRLSLTGDIEITHSRMYA